MIGILTFHWADNYGALLQAYALKTYLSRRETAEILPLFPKELRKRYNIFRWEHRWQLRENLRLIRDPQVLARLLRRKRLMGAFRRNFLMGGRSVRTLRSADACPEMRSCVVGSDQVWNPEITLGLREEYFCGFKRRMALQPRCTAYAASLGNERLEERFDEELREKLRNFDAVSVRERSAVPYISELYGRTVYPVLDPVFLLTGEEWTKLVKERMEAGVFVYYTYENPAMLRFARQLGRAFRKRVYVLCERSTARWPDSLCDVRGSGPLEFLSCLKSASYVVTNSFHALAFSLIFRKQFAVFESASKNARIYDLLQIAGLENRIVRDPELFSMEDVIDWQKVSARLHPHVQSSQEFISHEILSFPDAHTAGRL